MIKKSLITLKHVDHASKRTFSFGTLIHLWFRLSINYFLLCWGFIDFIIHLTVLFICNYFFFLSLLLFHNNCLLFALFLFISFITYSSQLCECWLVISLNILLQSVYHWTLSLLSLFEHWTFEKLCHVILIYLVKWNLLINRLLMHVELLILMMMGGLIIELSLLKLIKFLKQLLVDCFLFFKVIF